MNKIREEMVVFLLQGDGKDTKVLLGMKTQKTGKGKWNGYGGGVEPGETLHFATQRELKSELGIDCEYDDLEEHGFLNIEVRYAHNSKISQLHIFTLRHWQGEFTESNEMLTPTWFSIDDLPEMIESDKFWIPRILENKDINGSIIRNLDTRTTRINLLIAE